MNSFARRVLPVEDKKPFEKMVLSFHPERSQAKVKFLLDQAECPVSNPPPMTMIINIPERVLLIKVTKMSDEHGDTVGYTLVFYDITDAVIRDEPGVQRPDAKRQLLKIPTVSGNRIVLVDAAVVRYVRAEGHYTWVHTAQGSSFCNLTIGDLESRLDRLVPAHPPQLRGQPRFRRADRARRRQGHAQTGSGDDRACRWRAPACRACSSGWASPRRQPSAEPGFRRRATPARAACRHARFVHAIAAVRASRGAGARGARYRHGRQRAGTRPEADEETHAMIPAGFRLPRAALGRRRDPAARRARPRRQAAGRRPQPAADDEAALRAAEPPDRPGQDSGAARHRAGGRRDPHRRDDHRERPAPLRAAGREVPLLVEGAGWIADPQVRYRGTIGGDISHGDPATTIRR